MKSKQGNKKIFKTITPFLILVVIGVLMTYALIQGWKINKSSENQTVRETPDVKTDITSAWETYRDTKYGFSLKLPSYFKKLGNWSGASSSNPDYLYFIQKPETTDENRTFKKQTIGRQLAEVITISVSKNTTIDKWQGKERTIFNSDMDGWGSDHKFTNQEVFLHNGLSLLKFTYLDLAEMAPEPDSYDENAPNTGFAIQKDSMVIVLRMKHFIEDQEAVKKLIDQIESTFKFTN